MMGATGIIGSSLSIRVIQMNERAPIGRTRTSKSALLSIVTIACWTLLLVIILSSVFANSKLSKQLRSKDRQSTQSNEIASVGDATPTTRSE